MVVGRLTLPRRAGAGTTAHPRIPRSDVYLRRGYDTVRTTEDSVHLPPALVQKRKGTD